MSLHDILRPMVLGVAAFIGAKSALASDRALQPPFAWTSSAPLVAPLSRDGETFHSIKDPSVVYHAGRWHLFCTVRGVKRSHQIEYISFHDWEHTANAERAIVPLTDGYYCAPQVFYFTPHKKWYLVCQISDPTRKPELQPAFSTTETLADPQSWSKPVLLYQDEPARIERWIDFWVICDDTHARLFFTSLDGKFWRADAPVDRFPHGWSQPQVVLEADIFEAAHVYRLKGDDRYLAIIEAQGGGRRYYKAYLADRLDGAWRLLADTQEAPFAGAANVTFPDGPWAESVSHGELLRDGFDEHLVVDPDHLRLLYQGATDREMAGKPYGQIPWRLGVLIPASK